MCSHDTHAADRPDDSDDDDDDAGGDDDAEGDDSNFCLWLSSNSIMARLNTSTSCCLYASYDALSNAGCRSNLATLSPE